MPRKWTKAEHEKLTHKGSVQEHEPVIDQYCRGTMSGPRAYELLARGTKLRLAAGSLAIELAHSESDIMRQSEWLKKAASNFAIHERFVDNDQTHPITHVNAARALFELAQLPIHAAILASGALPTPAVAKRAFTNSLAVAERVASGTDQAWQHDENDVHTKRMLGTLVKQSSLLLHQRFGIREGLDMNQFALSAWEMQRTQDVSTTWDINVLADSGNGPFVSQRAQIIPGANLLVPCTDPTIKLIRIRPDLSINSWENFTAQHIIQELSDEAAGSTTASHTLDQRTAQMLDILG